jgi:hypothetical protein
MRRRRRRVLGATGECVDNATSNPLLQATPELLAIMC